MYLVKNASKFKNFIVEVINMFKPIIIPKYLQQLTCFRVT